tara:strand:+ start:420 stop:686 length:267 start_codon:yes stop_codon:yes gene_type:complete
MYLLNKLRNFININPISRRLFVSVASKFMMPLLNLQNYLSLDKYKIRRKASLWRKTFILFEKLELEKVIISKSSTSFFYKNGTAFNIA